VPAHRGFILVFVATEQAVTPAPESTLEAENSIVLQGLRNGQPVSVTIRYSAIQEVRAAVKRPDEVASGVIVGALAEDRIVIGGGAARSIGLFRTQPAGWPAVTEPDCERLRRDMPRANAALLMVVRTLAQRPWSAALFLVDPKRPATTDPPLLEFPFDEYLLRNGWLTDLTPPPMPRQRIPAKPRRRSRKPWIAAVAAALLLAGGAAAAYRFHWNPFAHAAVVAEVPELTPVVTPPIGLRATRSLDELEVSWNRDSDLVRAAKAATLVIRNGSVSRVVPVSVNQLRVGRVMYHPVPGVDVDFRLELAMPDGRTTAESIQIVGFDTTPALTLPVAAQPRLKPPAREQSADRIAPPSRVQTEPLPVHRVNPTLTRDVVEEMRKANGQVTMSVLVTIDTTGKVDTAKVIAASGEPSPSGSHIRLAALTAAKQWRFRPATAAGRPVPSSLTLAFSF
jgi:hypothetical protein